ncbi:lipid A biosynthesis acyltransferase [Aestuariicella hydrocarbonica]|uniref:Lipid A biosynthesis acyltransferase n=1 Tax=Pseudomaricurvus hydrocarbonicus TaxID=1470433 RepID=A0A9E5JSS6_9GAMM|nr:lipid A biosynthesis acyltransferase [Aestuariicella hydrocarbonica]NHO64903.1 lipid A biosynthesis acyltransferase [Aestuariicella hydrocarbonica]
MATHWSQIQESGALIGIRFMFFIYRWFGRWAFGLLLYPVIAYFYLTKKTARQASQEYLTRIRAFNALPNNASLRQQSFRHFLHFGRGLLDKLAAWCGAFNYHNVQFRNRDDFLNMVDQGDGALVIVSHLGNLEVCRALADASQRIKLNVMVHTKHAENFNRLMNNLDGDNHLNLIQVTEVTPATAILLQEKLRNGEVVVIAGDRTPVSGGRQSAADFLGAAALFPQGPYILASVLRCPVYLMFCVRGEQGYEISFEAFADSIRLSRKNREQELAFWVQKFADRLAHYTLLHPLQWNNFYPFWVAPATSPSTPL